MLAGVWRRELEMVGWVLADVYARGLSGLEDKLVCCLKLAADVVGSGVWEFVDYADKQDS